MNIRDLRYLIAIADHQHFGRAAESCFVSQPALSMQLKKLESSLGVQLIERNSKFVLLTDVGKAITEQATEILHRVDSLKDFAKQARDPFSGEVHLGVIPTLAPYLLPYIIPEIVKLYPKLKIFLVEQQTEQLTNKLKNGKLDAALFGLPVVENDFSALPLFDEELLLAVHKSHALSKRKFIRHTDLSQKVLLLLEDGHCLRDQVLSLCHIVNATPDKSFQATSLETLRHMVASKVGMTLMPKLACRENDDLHYLSFATPRPTRTVGLIWRQSSAKSILFEHLTMAIKKILSKKKLVKVINTSLICQKN
jgi:LysR family hydrogen peroxide-inducible transcriptional activator